MSSVVVAMGVAQGHVESFSVAVKQLRAAGLYMSDTLVETVANALPAGT